MLGLLVLRLLVVHQGINQAVAKSKLFPGEEQRRGGASNRVEVYQTHGITVTGNIHVCSIATQWKPVG